LEVSIIIPTYNGARKIPRLLDALLQQTTKEFRVIIVIDGSTDNTITVLENYRSRFQDLVIVCQENKGRAAVRNRGAQETQTELLIFFDDDMEPFPDSVERHIRFQRTHEASIVCGHTVEIPSASKTDIQNYKAELSIKWTSGFSDDLNRVLPERVFLSAASMSIPKEIFHLLHGFDERLTDIEDLEFAKRAIDKKIPIYFDKANQAIHHDLITCKSYINRVRQYTRAQQLLHKLYPEKFPDRTLNSSPKKVFYALFSFSFFPRMIDETRILKVLPKVVRYKIYDSVIYSLGVVFPKKNIN